MDNNNVDVRKKNPLISAGLYQKDPATSAGLHVNSQSVLMFIAGLSLPLLVPLIQFGVVFNLWSQHSVEVKRDYCSNSCWDTTFKAGYETGIGSYKHVYFNVTWQSGVMWTVTLLTIGLAYESTKYLGGLLSKGTVRPRMLILYMSAIYPHYYAFWAMWNYLNDDFYPQMGHQLLFTLTEVVSTLVVLHLCDSLVHPAPHLLIIVVAIAVGHVATAGADQFVKNVMQSEGELHQVLRDIGFMIPDLLHICLPLRELSLLARSRRKPATHLISNKLAAASVSIATSIWITSLLL